MLKSVGFVSASYLCSCS